MKVSKSIVGVVCFIIMLTILTLFKEGLFPKKKLWYSQDRFQDTLKMFDNLKTNRWTDLADTGSCVLNTNGLSKAKGVNMKLYFPCSWKVYTAEDTTPTLIKQYTHQLEDSLLIGATYSIEKSPFTLNTQAINKMRSTKGFLKEITEQYGDFISSNSMEINGIKADEVIIENRQPKAYSYFIINHFYYKQNIITLSYMLIAVTQSQAGYMFDSYQRLFRRLVSKTVIM